MPRGDGTGPMGQGPGKGQGGGMGQKQGGGAGRKGGRSPGPDGNCVCLSCGETLSHQQGVPCNQIKCPKCGTPMNRQRFAN